MLPDGFHFVSATRELSLARGFHADRQTGILWRSDTLDRHGVAAR